MSKRLKSGSVAAACGVLMGVVPSAFGQVDATWLTDAPGTFDWSNPVNWDSNPLYPNNGNGGNDFNAIIASSTNSYIVQLSEDIDLLDLSLTTTTGSLDLAGFNLSLAGGLTHQNSMLTGGGGNLITSAPSGFSDALVTGLGQLTLQGDTSVRDTTFLGISNMAAQGNLTFDSTTCDDVCDTNLSFSGPQGIWRGTGDILLGANSSFSIDAASTFDIENDQRMFWDNSGSQSVFTNAGTLTKTTGAGVTFFDGMTFQNTGTLQVETGTFRANSADVPNNNLVAGTWNILNGSTLDLVGLNLAQNRTEVTLQGAGASFDALRSITRNTAAGNISVADGATFETSGNFDNRGAITVSNGSTFRVGVGQNFDSIIGGMWARGVLNLNDGVFQFDGADVIILNATVHLNGDGAAVIDENGDSGFRNLDRIAANGRFELSNLTTDFTTGGDFTVVDGGRLVVNEGVTFRVAPGFTLTNFDDTLPGDTLLADGRFEITGELR
ncbi:MAG: hypothetical protein KDA21_05660, partial [Phycisphaerales bacterium]|nr:hypothetical protein [Phycisphaerales bacterium]